MLCAMSTKSKQGPHREETLHLGAHRGMWGAFAGLITAVLIAYPLSASIAFATRAKPQSVLGAMMFYGPTNKNAFKYLDEKTGKSLSTHPDNVNRQFVRNDKWYAEKGPDGRTNLETLIEKCTREGAEVLVDGRSPTIAGYEHGNFVRPTILNHVEPRSDIAATEIFGPVLSMMHVSNIDEAIALVNGGAYGNQACLFTTSGAAARKFRYEARVGNIGINLAVAAPTRSAVMPGGRQAAPSPGWASPIRRWYCAGRRSRGRRWRGSASPCVSAKVRAAARLPSRPCPARRCS